MTATAETPTPAPAAPHSFVLTGSCRWSDGVWRGLWTCWACGIEKAQGKVGPYDDGQPLYRLPRARELRQAPPCAPKRLPARVYAEIAQQAEQQHDWLLGLRLRDMAVDRCARSSSAWRHFYDQLKQAHLRAIEAWNRTHPEGTAVRFWPGVREGEGRLSRTRSKAWLVSEHGSVLVEDYSGGICLTHVEPIRAARIEIEALGEGPGVAGMLIFFAGHAEPLGFTSDPATGGCVAAWLDAGAAGVAAAEELRRRGLPADAQVRLTVTGWRGAEDGQAVTLADKTVCLRDVTASWRSAPDGGSEEP